MKKALQFIPPNLLIKLSFASDTPKVDYWLNLFSRFSKEAYFDLVRQVIICYLHKGICKDCCQKQTCRPTIQRMGANIDFRNLSVRWGPLLGRYYGFTCNACPENCAIQPSPESESKLHIFRSPEKSGECMECGEPTNWWMKENSREFWICPSCIHMSMFKPTL